MNIKRITAAIAGLAMMTSLAACDSSNQTSETTISTTEGTTVSTSQNVLVAYYSASGHTERVAKDIAEVTDGELFEIEPADEYTSDDLNYNNSDSRVCQEHDDESKRDVALKTTTPENWSKYTTVFIGYPIWWGIAAWPVNHFASDNDFTGKTVIPFATSASSSLGASGTNLEKLAGTGDWQTGQRFSSSASTDDVTSWVKGLKL